MDVTSDTIQTEQGTILRVFVDKGAVLWDAEKLYDLRDNEVKKYINDYYFLDGKSYYQTQDVTQEKIVFLYPVKKKTEEQKYIECLTYFLGL